MFPAGKILRSRAVAFLAFGLLCFTGAVVSTAATVSGSLIDNFGVPTSPKVVFTPLAPYQTGPYPQTVVQVVRNAYPSNGVFTVTNLQAGGYSVLASGALASLTIGVPPGTNSYWLDDLVTNQVPPYPTINVSNQYVSSGSGSLTIITNSNGQLAWLNIINTNTGGGGGLTNLPSYALTTNDTRAAMEPGVYTSPYALPLSYFGISPTNIDCGPGLSNVAILVGTNGGTVVLGNGTYSLPNGYNLTNAYLQLRGQGGGTKSARFDGPFGYAGAATKLYFASTNGIRISPSLTAVNRLGGVLIRDIGFVGNPVAFTYGAGLTPATNSYGIEAKTFSGAATGAGCTDNLHIEDCSFSFLEYPIILDGCDTSVIEGNWINDDANGIWITDYSVFTKVAMNNIADNGSTIPGNSDGVGLKVTGNCTQPVTSQNVFARNWTNQVYVDSTCVGVDLGDDVYEMDGYGVPTSYPAMIVTYGNGTQVHGSTVVVNTSVASVANFYGNAGKFNDNGVTLESGTLGQFFGFYGIGNQEGGNSFLQTGGTLTAPYSLNDSYATYLGPSAWQLSSSWPTPFMEMVQYNATSENDLTFQNNGTGNGAVTGFVLANNANRGVKFLLNGTGWTAPGSADVTVITNTATNGLQFNSACNIILTAPAIVLSAPTVSVPGNLLVTANATVNSNATVQGAVTINDATTPQVGLTVFGDAGVDHDIADFSLYTGTQKVRIDSGGNLIASNSANIEVVGAGQFIGPGSGLTSLNASQLTTGTVPLGVLPAAVITNNYIGPIVATNPTNGFNPSLYLGMSDSTGVSRGGLVVSNVIISTSRGQTYLTTSNGGNSSVTESDLFVTAPHGLVQVGPVWTFGNSGEIYPYTTANSIGDSSHVATYVYSLSNVVSGVLNANAADVTNNLTVGGTISGNGSGVTNVPALAVNAPVWTNVVVVNDNFSTLTNWQMQGQSVATISGGKLLVSGGTSSLGNYLVCTNWKTIADNWTFKTWFSVTGGTNSGSGIGFGIRGSMPSYYDSSLYMMMTTGGAGQGDLSVWGGESNNLSSYVIINPSSSIYTVPMNLNNWFLATLTKRHNQFSLTVSNMSTGAVSFYGYKYLTDASLPETYPFCANPAFWLYAGVQATFTNFTFSVDSFQNPDWILIGDSIAYGYGITNDTHCFARLLQAAHPGRIAVEAQPSMLTTNCLDSLIMREITTCYSPTKGYINALSVNDVEQGVATSVSKTSLTNIQYELTNANPGKLVWFALPTPGQSSSYDMSPIAQFESTNFVPYTIDVFTPLLGNYSLANNPYYFNGQDTAGGLHPNELGAALMFDRYSAALYGGGDY